MPSRRAALALFATLLCVAPAAAAPPPEPVSAFEDGFGSEGYSPDYPSTNVSNVSVDVEVASNGSARWTERATLSNPETVDAFRGNESLRRAAVEYTFDYRFDDHVTALRSELAGDALLVTYRTDEGVERGPGGGVVFAPFASYGNDYYPGVADVTIRPPAGHTVVGAPAAFVRSGNVLRWNATTGPGRPGVDPGIVTFAPGNALVPGLDAWLATAAAFGAATLRVALRNALVFGVPFGLVLSGVVAAVDRRRWQVPAFVSAPVLGFVWVAVAAFPATNPMPAFWPFGLPFVLVAVAPVVLGGVALHALARWG